MGLFSKKFSQQSAAPAWTPRVDLATAGPLVRALANGPASNDAQMRAAIARQVRASDAPTDMMVAIQNIQNDPDLLKRPWIWLLAVQREAVAAGDHHVSAAALLWASYFSGVIAPKYDRPTEVWQDVQLDLIPNNLKEEIMALGLSSAAALPPEFVIAGDDTGTITAESLAVVAPTWFNA